MVLDLSRPIRVVPWGNSFELGLGSRFQAPHHTMRASDSQSLFRVILLTSKTVETPFHFFGELETIPPSLYATRED
jgi:hypothetical protein